MPIPKNKRNNGNTHRQLFDFKIVYVQSWPRRAFDGDTGDSSSAASLLSRDLFGKTVHLNNDIIKTNMHNIPISYLYIKLVCRKRERERKKQKKQ